MFPLTGCAGAPRDEFIFKLIFDLYDRTAPQSPAATAPRTSGGLEGSLFADRLSHFLQVRFVSQPCLCLV